MTLVIIAAGMGSRFGGLKQMEPVGLNGEIIAEFSVYDAKRAGFDRAVFVIKKEMEQDFKEKVLNKISKDIDTKYVFQDLEDIPEGFSIPNGRIKPWGTGHAVLSCRNVVKEPFAVFNADDFYGASAFDEIYKFLHNQKGSNYCMAGYSLKNTVTENGTVSRGICETDSNGYLINIKEIKKISKTNNEIKYTNDEKVYFPIASDTTVSMNAWGFTTDIFEELQEGFENFLTNNKDALSGELYLPSVVDEAVAQGKRKVAVLPSKDMWYGFTYKEDMQPVRHAIQQLILSGKYPQKLWE